MPELPVPPLFPGDFPEKMPVLPVPPLFPGDFSDTPGDFPDVPGDFPDTAAVAGGAGFGLSFLLLSLLGLVREISIK